MSKLIDLTGQRFGQLRITSQAGSSKEGRVMWNCLCDCGKQPIVRGDSLRNGDTKSCGCLRRGRLIETHTIHGKCDTPAYISWRGMRKRCNDSNNPSYRSHGDRGITICKRWMKFENFYADMGDRPEGMSIERKDNNKGYSPDNCKWATPREQARNRRDNRMVTHNRRTQCLSAWAEELETNYHTLRHRLKVYPPQIAFNM